MAVGIVEVKAAAAVIVVELAGPVVVGSALYWMPAERMRARIAAKARWCGSNCSMVAKSMAMSSTRTTAKCPAGCRSSHR